MKTFSNLRARSTFTDHTCLLIRVVVLGSLLGLGPSISSTEQTPQPARPSKADLPPLLTLTNGTSVTSAEQWTQRRNEIRQQMMDYYIGTFPTTVPILLKAELLDEQRHQDGSIRKRLKLIWATPNRKSFEIHVWIPANATDPRPLLLTQPRGYQLRWAEMALKRGYVVCLYPGVDSHHREKEFPGYDSVWQEFRKEYPEATWSEISCKAWLASRSLDYLLDPRQSYPINPAQVGIIGFSRYGKQSLIAAAFDPRISSVVARSPGSPGSTPYRFSSRNTFAETPADFPSEWFRPQLRSYLGREHKLPMGAHGWLALIAPRRCLIHTAHNDGSEPTFAVERAYREAQKVYRLLGASPNLRVLYRTGQHGPITEEQRRQNMDWFDLSFNRGDATQKSFPEEFIHRFDWAEWNRQQRPVDLAIPKKIETDSTRTEIMRCVQWSLGETPALPPTTPDTPFLTDAESKMMTHDRWGTKGITRIPVTFGNHVKGNVYAPADISQPAPVIIWLHPYSYHSGYNEGYGVKGTTIYHRLAKQGFVVLAFDQCGFGLRLLEGRDFYSKHPHWSRLGRMVHDVRSAVDFVIEGKGRAKSPLPPIDPSQVFVLGYAAGGTVAIYAAALDPRIRGVASFCGFTPLRTDTDEKTTGGIRRLWEWHALQPKLGLFHRREDQIPFDYHDTLSLIAPRACLIVSPTRDRDATIEDVTAMMGLVKKRWATTGTEKNQLTHLAPDDVNRFQAEQHKIFSDWVQALLAEE